MTKTQIKFIRSLALQKYRKLHNAFLVEGDKNAGEWLRSGAKILQLVATTEWLSKNRTLLAGHPETLVIEALPFELEKISNLTQAQEVLLVIEKPARQRIEKKEPTWLFYLEKIQDPGNMGTILRTADWFGISDVLVSHDSVEVFNPKVVQATMGSLTRINCVEMDLDELFDFATAAHLPLYASSLQGQDIFEMTALPPGIIALGNESSGLSEKLSNAAKEKFMIPRLGAAESLNVGVAAGIIAALLTRTSGK